MACNLQKSPKSVTRLTLPSTLASSSSSGLLRNLVFILLAVTKSWRKPYSNTLRSSDGSAPASAPDSVVIDAELGLGPFTKFVDLNE